MKELIEFLKELMKSAEAMPRETFCCQSSAFPFHQKPNSNWLLLRNKGLLDLKMFRQNKSNPKRKNDQKSGSRKL